MNGKLTMVSVIVKGQRRTVFTSGRVVKDTTGKERTVVDNKVLHQLTRDLGRGQGYTVG